VGQALPPANRSGSDQELAGESACPTFFHEVPRAQTVACPTKVTGTRQLPNEAIFPANLDQMKGLAAILANPLPACKPDPSSSVFKDGIQGYGQNQGQGSGRRVNY
jgi:hypothetical protein